MICVLFIWLLYNTKPPESMLTLISFVQFMRFIQRLCCQWCLSMLTYFVCMYTVLLDAQSLSRTCLVRNVCSSRSSLLIYLILASHNAMDSMDDCPREEGTLIANVRKHIAKKCSITYRHQEANVAADYVHRWGCSRKSQITIFYKALHPNIFSFNGPTCSVSSLWPQEIIMGQ
jgi:hypothetical protein